MTSQIEIIPLLTKKEFHPSSFLNQLDYAIEGSAKVILSHQFNEGYWWYTLEANESINAEYILMTHYIDQVDVDTEQKLIKHIKSSQLEDGSWPLYYGGSGNLSTTIECYFALKIAGQSSTSDCLQKAKNFILSKGGASKCRVFTRIHLALFGLIPWEACPAMPVSFIHFPSYAPLSIYDFSYWARVTIVPLLVLLNQKKVKQLPKDFLNEIFTQKNSSQVDWSFKTNEKLFSIERWLIEFDNNFKRLNKKLFFLKPLKEISLKKCEEWLRSRLSLMEDIYPALAYGAMALYALGYSHDDPIIKKCLAGLKKFQTPALHQLGSIPTKVNEHHKSVCQQCCVSPVWDTAWVGVSLLESQIVNGSSPKLLEAGKWLMKNQVITCYGDWSLKNKRGKPGGWAFEFQNDPYPDIDDTIEVLVFLHQLELPKKQKDKSIKLGLNWLLSMQSKNGGWAAFDKNNTKEFVNRIPFSDEKACLDPPTPDITGRMLEYLALINFDPESGTVKKGISFLESAQEKNGSWEGRWGVNYIYGTWAVLGGLSAIGYDLKSPRIQKALNWLLSVQNEDGGFGESCASYEQKKYVPLEVSVPSQTAWALMALTSCGLAKSKQAQKALEFLLREQQSDGTWSEQHFTGTGFPGHFFIRYHGYFHYFPLLALAKYKKAMA